MAQLPAEASGTAAGVLIWSFTCLAFNILLLWLLWTANERRSYIFLISSLTLLASTTSIIEQIHDIIFWKDVMTARFEWIKTDPTNPMLAASDGCTGMDLVLWTIRWGCYIGEAGLAFFWSFSLTQAVYCWQEDIRLHQPLVLINQVGKALAIAIAVTTMCVLQIDSLVQSYYWWSIVLHLFYCFFCCGGLFMFLLIFIEFIQTRRLFRRMNSQQRREYLQEEKPDFGRHRARTNSTSMSVAKMAPQVIDNAHFGALQQREGGIYDKYLIARTFIPFIALCLFEIDNILINVSRQTKMNQIAQAPAANLTAAAARSYLVNFIPGCLASLVVPLAFGTTRQFRDKLSRTFLPGRRRRGDGHGGPQSSDLLLVSYVDMDSDAGILSRNRRLDMEKRLHIEVTYEFEVRNEEVHEETATTTTTTTTTPSAAKLNSILNLTTTTETTTTANTMNLTTTKTTTKMTSSSEMRNTTANKSYKAPPPVSDLMSGRRSGRPNQSTATDNVDNHHRWDDTERILPKKPSMSIMKGRC